MIIKPRGKPKLLLQLEALDRRVIEHHQKKQRIKKDLAWRRKGYKGELSTDYYLSFLPQKDHFIINDLRLQDENGFFQLDTLLLTKNFIVVADSKNYNGPLLFDDFNQLIRISDENVEEGFSQPIIQVGLQCQRLNNWLELRKIPLPPIEKLVVISHPSTIIKTTYPNKVVEETVIHAAYLPQKMNEIWSKFPNKVFSQTQINQLSSMLVKSHRPYNKRILSTYKLKKKDLLTGVICPRCASMPMERKSGSWQCETCSYKCKQAHLSALLDYSLLVEESICNKEARELLHLSSENITKQLLIKGNFIRTGATSSRRYILDFDK